MKRRAFLQQAATMAVALPSLRRAWAADDPALVRTPAGTLRGTVRPDGVRSFLGVPFAQPPVDDLRFREPRALPHWEGVRDALKFAVPPIQPGRDTDMHSEDCLYLNVWAPPQETKFPPPYPVFVWIHGGGNTGGWSGGAMYDHAAFAKSGIVTVTLSYRLGALGFLEMGDLLGAEYAGSGNNGLRDLALGLRWVHENIASFGGDPTRITVGGQSAGAKNVAALLASPETHGTIRRAVMESGSGQTVHTTESAQEVARLFRDALGISAGTSPTDTKARLLTATPKELLQAQAQASSHFDHDFPFRAVVGNAFLPQRPVDAIAAGVAKDVALLIGTNRDESLAFFSRQNAERPIAARELSHLTVPQIHEQRLRYDKQIPGLSLLDERIRLLTAEEYWIPSVRFAQAHASQDGATYMYRFDHPATSGDHAGYAAHASEVAFVWNDLSASAAKEATDLARRMHGAWSAFVATGVPAAEGIPTWPRYSADTRRTLIFQDSGDTVTDDPRGDERRLWDGYFRCPHPLPLSRRR